MIRRPARLVRLGTALALALLGPLLSLLLPTPAALAAEPESVVVRNRLYSTSNRFELALNYTFGIANTLTATQGPVLDIGYHLTEAWTIDLMVGYMFGGPTDLAGQVQCPGASSSGAAANCPAPGAPNNTIPPSIFANKTPGTSNTKMSDVPDLWAMNGVMTQLGVRWEPVYGKISLLTSLPVHFKWYIAAAGGVSQFSRSSENYCTSYGTNDCNFTGSIAAGNKTYDTLQENQLSWVASAGTGLRFIFLRDASLNLGLREYFWGDSYRSGFTANDWFSNPTAISGKAGSTILNNTGVDLSLFADLGLSWTF